ncbi:MAG: prohibitin family protein [Alphaproteobacteria bacterium]|nr:prohibitin family protein [Alphaproteobacteria bacterium]
MRPETGWFGKARIDVALVLLISAFVLVACWETIFVPIRSGEGGVYWSRFFGGTRPTELTEGTALKFPWDEIVVYDLRIQNLVQSTSLLTRDGLVVNINWSVRYHPSRAALPELHRRIGPDYAQRVVLPEVVAALREIIGNNSAADVYASDEDKLLSAIRIRALEKMTRYSIDLDAILIQRLDIPDELEKAIIDKQTKEQIMLSYRFRILTAEDERRRIEIEAHGFRAFEDISKVSILKLKGVEATTELAKSPNAKIVIVGPGQNALPVLMQMDVR